VSIKFRKFALWLILAGGSFLVPMNPQDVEELLSQMNQPRIEIVVGQQKREEN